MEELVVDARVTIPARDLSFSASRSGGAGGQNVNKVSSKVDLRFDLPGTTALSPAVKARLAAIARHRLDEDGCVQIVSQTTRDQHLNLEDARARLVELVRRALAPPPPRKKTRPSRGATQRRIDAKKQRSDVKRGRRAPDDE